MSTDMWIYNVRAFGAIEIECICGTTARDGGGGAFSSEVNLNGNIYNLEIRD